MNQSWTVNSEASLAAYQKWCANEYEKHKHLTFSQPRRGLDRSLTQNSLFHVWCSEIVAHFLGVNKKLVARNEIDGVKRTVKKAFWQDNPETHKWMVYEIRCPIKKVKKKDFTSSASWRSGEMFMILTWMQFWAAEFDDPLILESKGEFAKKQREQNS